MGNILDNKGNVIGQDQSVDPNAPFYMPIANIQTPIIAAGLNTNLKQQLSNQDPNLLNLGINEQGGPSAINFGETGTSTAGDFQKTSPDEFYASLLKGILNKPGTDFSQVNQPLMDYQNSLSKMSAENAIPEAYSDIIKGVGSKSEKQFQDYLGQIQNKTPTPAEQALQANEKSILDQALADIDRQIAQSVAGIKLTGEEYGLSGAGRVSEPITSAIAQTQVGGLRQKAGAQTQLAQTQLQRLAEKEKAQQEAVTQAFRERYQRGPVEELMMAQAYPSFAQLQQGEKELLYKVASDEANRRLQGLQIASTEQQNLVDNLFKTMLTGLEIQSKENITQGGFDLQKFLQQQQIEWDKQKTAQEMDLAQRQMDFKQRLADKKPEFWEGINARLPGLLMPTVSDFGGGSGIAAIGSMFA